MADFITPNLEYTEPEDGGSVNTWGAKLNANIRKQDLDIHARFKRSGDTMSGPLGVVAGTAAAPGVFISGDSDTGPYSPAPDMFGISTGGVGRFVLSNTLLSLAVGLMVSGSTALAGLTVSGNATLGDAAGDTVTVNAGTTTFVQGVANGVGYLNASKAFTTSSALTFNGARQAITSPLNGAVLELLRLSNNGTGDGTQAQLAFLAANTNYAQITGGFAGAPSLICNVSTGGYQAWQIGSAEQTRLTSTGLGIGTSFPRQRVESNGAFLSSGAATALHASTSFFDQVSPIQTRFGSTGSAPGVYGSFVFAHYTGNGALSVNSLAIDQSANTKILGASGDTVGTSSYNLQFANINGTAYTQINHVLTGSGGVNGFGGELRFYTKGDNSPFLTEAGRFSANQNLVIGGVAEDTTSTRLTLRSAIESGSTAPIFSTVNANAGARQLSIFHAGSNVGIFNARDAALILGANNTEAVRVSPGLDWLIGTSVAPVNRRAGSSYQKLKGSVLEGSGEITVSTTDVQLTKLSGVGGFAAITFYNNLGGAQQTDLVMWANSTATVVATTNSSGLAITYSVASAALYARTATGTAIMTVAAFTV